jgi:chemotaxis protein CheD
MFAVSASSLEVGQRNEAAVRDLMKAHRIPVVATATGGSKGRTIRVEVGTSAVTVREAGGKDTELVAGSRTLEAVA